MSKKQLSEEERKAHNLNLLEQSSKILDKLCVRYSLGEINELTGKVDIDKGKYKVTFTYVEGENDETTE